MELAREQPVHVVVVQVERVAQIRERAPDHADARVDLFAAVTAREAERKPAVDVDRRVAVTDHGDARHVRVGVFDDRAPGHRAPHDVERAHALAAERALDARTAEVVDHHAVERAVAADRNDARARPERGQHAGKHAIAFLPVGARDVEVDPRSIAVRGASLELDVRLRRREPADADVDPFGSVGVDHVAGNRHRLTQGWASNGPHSRPRCSAASICAAVI